MVLGIRKCRITLIAVVFSPWLCGGKALGHEVRTLHHPPERDMDAVAALGHAAVAEVRGAGRQTRLHPVRERARDYGYVFAWARM